MTEFSGQPRHIEPAAAFAASLRSPDRGSAVVVVAGELDIASVPRLEEVLEQAVHAGAGQVRVDLARLSFCGAAGVTVLVQAHRTLAQLGRSLHLEHIPATIEQSLRAADAEWLLD